MSHFFSNLALALLGFSSWYFAGLGTALVLLPKHYKRYTFILAPILGLCLITLIGVFQITVVLTPLTPRITVLLLTLITVLTCFWLRISDFKLAWNQFRRNLISLWILPCLMVVVFAWLFHNNGFHLLVGGSDQLQYSEDARQIAEVMHTGSELDTPVPHQDRFLYQMNTVTLPYLKKYRRGAEVILATTSAVTQLNYETTFPIVILCDLLTLGLLLGFIGRLLLVSLTFRLLLQATFLASFYPLLLHIQGSLALITGLAPNILGLSLLFRVSRTPSWRWISLAIIVIAAYLEIYAEPALISLLIPSLLLIIWQFQRSSLQGYKATMHIITIYAAIIILAPFAIYSVVSNAVVNLLLAYKQTLTSISHSYPISETLPAFQIWTFIPILLGLTSYYDLTSFNTYISQLINAKPWLGFVWFIIFYIFALLGYLKKRHPLARLFAIILTSWTLASLLFAYQQSSLHFARSLQYAFPFALFGLVLLATRNRQFIFLKEYSYKNITTIIGSIILISFISLNIYTNTRTVAFITAHNLSNDPILLRFDEHLKEWKSLEEELAISASSKIPVLISGFKETIRPFAISIALRSQSLIVGDSILNFWKIYNANNYTWNDFNTKIPRERFQTTLQQESQPWPMLSQQLIKLSQQAVVAVNNGYPIEWLNTKDVYAPRITRFANICDVVYRNDYVVTLPKAMTSSLQKDLKGQYRTINKSGELIIRDASTAPKKLIMVYEGKPGDIKLRLQNKNHEGKRIAQTNNTQIEMKIQPDDIKKLSLIVYHSVKLRSIEWLPIQS